ncbi:MAG: hypothetical protein HY845_02290 [Candidatus Berkelbacteria bacterium]|nr:MAG: hypothetical protein HY845_02290 [Candidatus Berkelbacteria bacterium]
MTSASLGSIYPLMTSYQLNAISTPDVNNPTATLALLRVNDNTVQELYRVDYSRRLGWHLDSRKYGGLHHVRLSGIKTWRDALSRLTNSLEHLPMELPSVRNRFTNPESTLDV